MAVETRLHLDGLTLDAREQQHILDALGDLEACLTGAAPGHVELVLGQAIGRRQVTAELRVRLDDGGPILLSLQQATSATEAVRWAVADIQRGLARVPTLH